MKQIEQSESESESKISTQIDELLVVPYQNLTPAPNGNECQLDVWFMYLRKMNLFGLYCTTSLHLHFLFHLLKIIVSLNVDIVEIKQLLDKLVVVKFNGSLGTSLGFSGPK